ncbi:MAG: bifunctional phosphoribosylaminoimidazolecarboxamide formyltransferase/IMP cyclohydrolase [Synergistaceae bacterium]|jgi:phosphoribosylaminoimidazolecarboxamide formyltransferase/IMP cyclohydrolase|nr:bifunctional phosphoribosylaminoimidazolecarboxamide formyltransferase/IMP cyclohydrolase [Synergistaceae bacterium]
MDSLDAPRALISVWDKAGIADFASALAGAGYEVVSSSGTARYLRDNGVSVTEVLDITGAPAILGGRVKTLHPKIMGGILARRGHSEDESDRAEYGIPRIDVVVCTLYPFEETARKNATREELIEKIDIGGVSLIRAAAKNYEHVTVVTDPADYELVKGALSAGEIPLSLRRDLAVKAFLVTASYDATIHEGLVGALGSSCGGSAAAEKVIPLRMAQELRYGENPYQRAALYMPTLANPVFKQHSGKNLSYNNLLDLDTLLKGQAIFQSARACVIVKHTTPCGVAEADDAATAYERALASDPVSAFGGIVGFTSLIDTALAEKLAENFYEIVAAPEIDQGAIELLKSRKPNLRLLTITGAYAPREQITANRAGFLIQSETLPTPPRQEEGRWEGEPRPDLWDDLLFAWRAAALAKSNSIVLAKSGATVGIGGGFTNRVDAARYAIAQAGERGRGSVLASDAFFPFSDTVELAAEAGVAAIIQPGGSLKDAEVARRASELGVSMFVGGPRTFRH